ALDRRLAGRRDRVLRDEAFVGEKAAGDRRDQRRVECGEARELDPDLVAHAGRTQPPCTGWWLHRNSTKAGRPFAFSSSARLRAGTISDGLSTSSLWKPTALAMFAMHALPWSETFHV